MFLQILAYTQSKSLYISRAVSNCYGTEMEIWAGFGPVGNIEKNLGPIMSNFEVVFFVFSGAKTNLNSF